ncbi:hypothetical protein TNCV_4950861 [Trichonephila clavipes]|nr:hypothetical protein TNCV_4950861 [Trichonephila clavipes]
MFSINYYKREGGTSSSVIVVAWRRKKHTRSIANRRNRFVSSDEVKEASQGALREVAKNWLPAVLPEVTGTLEEVDVLRCCEQFRVRFSTPCPRTFGSTTYTSGVTENIIAPFKTRFWDRSRTSCQ